MRSKRTLIASPPFAPIVLGQILQVLLISLKSLHITRLHCSNHAKPSCPCI